jgi:sigma-B regulation protein RsbU (phosphoserine phosphatase)
MRSLQLSRNPFFGIQGKAVIHSRGRSDRLDASDICLFNPDDPPIVSTPDSIRQHPLTMKILLAEDETFTREILKATLLKANHEVIATQDGEEAWDALLRQSAQIIVSDWMMPKLNGLELCQKVRSRLRKDYVYFILMTTRSGLEDFRAAMDAGVDDFLTKSSQMDELLLRLRVAERILKYMGQVRQLKQLLPICSYCKKIRDDKDYWHKIESYISQHTGSDFSHSICPACYKSVVHPQLHQIQSDVNSDKG